MSRLVAHRRHLHTMATAKHKPECPWPDRAEAEAHNRRQARFEKMFDYAPGSLPRAKPCDGCVSDAEREQWARLAAEADEWAEGQP